MNKQDDPNRIRVQIDFAPAAFHELLELQDRTGAPSRGETVKYALRSLQWLANQVGEDGTLMLLKDGQRERVVFPYLQRSDVIIPAPRTSEQVEREQPSGQTRSAAAATDAPAPT